MDVMKWIITRSGSESENTALCAAAWYTRQQIPFAKTLLSLDKFILSFPKQKWGNSNAETTEIIHL